MRLHIFNPEHDIALASGLSNFTAPHAGRQLRHDLGFLPALWAEPGDGILVDDPDYTQRQWDRASARLLRTLGFKRSSGDERLFYAASKPISSCTDVCPWGWNSALKALLLRRGVDERVLPPDDALITIRDLSHRRTASRLLPVLRDEISRQRQMSAGGITAGESFECTSPQELEQLLEHYGQLVLKSPWSSSGRGLRFLSVGRTSVTMHEGWIHNIIATQGSVMAEPYYNKVKDLGMEFEVDGEGAVSYLGLSLFHTENGAYTGNIIATEKTKKQMISRYIPANLLSIVRENICTLTRPLFEGRYCGPFGVDMMVVATDDGQLALHPCVEINLRRTMGHVALTLSPTDDDIRRVMRIDYSENKYQLLINRL